jgi:hypothetical protein
MTSSSYLKIFLAITLGFGALHAGSLIAYLYSPLSYYHRANEYLRDIAYQVEDAPMRWEGMEYPDLSRDYYFFYRYPERVTVTTDKDGFRTTRYDVESYPVAVAGDSTIFGTHLSDSDTLPWRLSEAIETPVFNAANSSLSNIFAHPKLGDIEVFIDVLTERSIFPRILKRRQSRIRKVDFQPLARKSLNALEAVGEIPPQRYSLPLIILNNMRKMAGDFKTWRKGGEQPRLYMRHHMLRSELDETVAVIAARKRAIDSLGIRYVFLPIPAKQNLHADNVDDYTRNFLPVLFERLRAEGIEYVDLDTPFRAHKDEELFYAYDTHWNKRGTALATKVIAEQIFGR